MTPKGAQQQRIGDGPKAGFKRNEPEITFATLSAAAAGAGRREDFIFEVGGREEIIKKFEEDRNQMPELEDYKEIANEEIVIAYAYEIADHNFPDSSDAQLLAANWILKVYLTRDMSDRDQQRLSELIDSSPRRLKDPSSI